jgi:predicted AlkP superfamily phosphohydrolase/phosphomutase/Flp pilus assembly protein TadD
MPALRRIVEAGASGALLCSQPPVPVAQWTSLVTGKRPWQHRVCHPIERISDTGGAVAVTATRRRSLALWEMLAQAGKRSLIVGWPATHGERTENAVLVSDRYAVPTAGPGVKPWPSPPPGTYWPEEIHVRLDDLRMSPADVQVDVVSRYVPEWRKIDQKRDRRIGQLRLFLATDFSNQAAMVRLLSGGQWDFAAVRFPALGAVSQLFLPYRPPRAEWAPEAEFVLYQNVISSACRMLDEMLHSLVQAAGSAASIMVVSGHGVNPSHLPPAARRPGDNEAWISPHGIFAAYGPSFAKDALVIGASVLDITPTILTCFGLPIGDDMEGRVLIEGFVKPPAVTRVPSWESVQVALSHPVVEAPDAPDKSKAEATLRRESAWNLARSYLDAGLQQEALTVLERLFRAFPERMELGQALFHCQLTLQKHTEAEETLQVVLEGLPAGIWSLLPQAELCLARKQMRQARELVNQAWNLHPTHPEALRWLGTLLLRLRDWSALEKLATQALKLDENEPLAWLGLAEAQLRKSLAAEAEKAALRAIGLNFYMPQAHFVLARALVAQGKWQQARNSMQNLLQLQPDNRAAATYAKRMGQGPRQSSTEN